MFSPAIVGSMAVWIPHSTLVGTRPTSGSFVLPAIGTSTGFAANASVALIEKRMERQGVLVMYSIRVL